MTNSPPETEREPIRTREAGWPTLLVFLAVSTALILLVLLLKREPAGRFLTGPSWLENLWLFASLLLVAVGGVIFGLGRLRPRDLGMGRGKLAEAAVTIGGIWLLIQGLVAAISLAGGGKVELHPSWAQQGVLRVLLWTAVMFLATGVYEEIAFRGFLFPQLYLKLGRSHRVRFWAALLLSQLAFAAAHVPAHVLLRGLSGSAFFGVALLQGAAGVLMLLLYLRTRNLWIAIGVHGLINAPTPLFDGTLPWELYFAVLLIGWPWLARRPEHRGLAPVKRAGTHPIPGAAAEVHAHSGWPPLQARSGAPTG